MEFNQAVHPTKEDQPRFSSWQPDYFFEGIDYFAMLKEFEPSEWDRRALASANPEHKFGKRKKLSAQKDVRGLINEMESTSCGLPCHTAPVPP